jgi:acetyl/propionyl-CoA carboxylase alpha subunit
VALVNEPSGPGIRVDSSLFSGCEVSQYYDSLLSKVIAWGSDREQALARLRRALGEYEIMGVKTTLPFLRRLIQDEAFVTGALYTRLLEKRQDLFEIPEAPESNEALLAAALLSHTRRQSGATSATSAASKSGGWRTAAREDATRPYGGGSWRGTF